MTPFFDGKVGLWTHFTPKAIGHLKEICDLGFDYLIVKVADGRSAYHPDAFHRLAAEAASLGLPLAAWAYVYPDHCDEQVKILKESLPKGVTELVLDAEVEWEQNIHAFQTAGDFCHAIAAATGHKVQLHLSSFYASDFHHLFPYESFLGHCASWMPQAYQVAGTTVETVIQRVESQALPLAQISLDRSLIPTVNSPAMLRAASDAGFHSLSVWLWDGDGQDLGVKGRQQMWADAIAAAKAAAAVW